MKLLFSTIIVVTCLAVSSVSAYEHIKDRKPPNSQWHKALSPEGKVLYRKILLKYDPKRKDKYDKRIFLESKVVDLLRQKKLEKKHLKSLHQLLDQLSLERESDQQNRQIDFLSKISHEDRLLYANYLAEIHDYNYYTPRKKEKVN